MNDIDILEEFINNYEKVQKKYKDDEIQAEIERSCYFEEVPYQAISNLISENKELKEENERLKHSITKATEIIDEYANETENDTKKLIEYQEKYLNN